MIVDNANKYLNDAAMSTDHDEDLYHPEGQYHYLSHPSPGLAAPCSVSRVLNSSPSALRLHWFNMFVQRVCTILFYPIILTITNGGFFHVAHSLRALADVAALVFPVHGIPISAQMIYYARRNTQPAASLE